MCVDEHLSAARLRRFWVPPGGAAASLRAPLVHVVREPLETCVSAYQYHLHSSEEWLRVPRKEEETLRNHSLYDSLVGMSWQQVLRTSSPRVGILLECRRSVRDQISQQADAFNMTRGDEQRVFTLRMEATEKDYDGTMWALFAFLGAAHQAWLGQFLPTMILLSACCGLEVQASGPTVFKECPLTQLGPRSPEPRLRSTEAVLHDPTWGTENSHFCAFPGRR